jgi:hypothetical protein
VWLLLKRQEGQRWLLRADRPASLSLSLWRNETFNLQFFSNSKRLLPLQHLDRFLND